MKNSLRKATVQAALGRLYFPVEKIRRLWMEFMLGCALLHHEATRQARRASGWHEGAGWWLLGDCGADDGRAQVRERTSVDRQHHIADRVTLLDRLMRLGRLLKRKGRADRMLKHIRSQHARQVEQGGGAHLGQQFVDHEDL